MYFIINKITNLGEEDMEKVYQLPKTTYIGGEEKALPLKEIINRLEVSLHMNETI